MKKINNDNQYLDQIHKEFPYLPNVSDVNIVENITQFKAELYDAEKSVEWLKKLIGAYETELLFRPANSRIHYFEKVHKYRIDAEKKE